MNQNLERTGMSPGAVVVPVMNEPVRYETGKGCLVLTACVVGMLVVIFLAIGLLGDPSVPGASG